MSNAKPTPKPCPNCGRAPKLVEVGYESRGAYNWSNLFLYELRCRRWLGLRNCFSPCKTKKVASQEPWYRWKEDLIDEWNNAVEAAINE